MGNIAFLGRVSEFQSINVLAATAVAVLSFATGCTDRHAALEVSAQNESLRPLTTDEALADYDAMLGAIRSLYGPLEYKERRFSYQISGETQRIRKELTLAKTDEEKLSKFYETLRLLQDGHVSLSWPMKADKRIGIIAVPVGTSFYVDAINPNLANSGIERGDEIISIDGKAPEDLLKTILKYSWWGNAESDRNNSYMFFIRPSYIPELQPTSAFALIEVKKADGSTATARLPWQTTSPFVKAALRPSVSKAQMDLSKLDGASVFSETAARLNEARAYVLKQTKKTGSESSDESTEETSVKEMGAIKPHYWSTKIQKKFGVTTVTPELERFKSYYKAWKEEERIYEPDLKYEVPDEMPDVFAALYKYNNKTILMIRQPNYSPEDETANLAVYSALLSQFQPIADVLLIDQTHNPGGSATYVDQFARLFAPKGLNGFFQFLNTDRKWLSGLMSWLGEIDASVPATQSLAQVLRSIAAGLERDQEAGLRLTKEGFSFGPSPIHRPATYTWKKPILLAIDELCASGGDAFPKIMKANKLATLFGRRTSGMGGSVEPVLDLPYSRAKLNLTRGLFTAYNPSGQYTDADMVENNGVQPDINYVHTVDDFRAGYLGYFEELSKAASNLQ